MSMISVPEIPATAADLVGRALKLTRLHWRQGLLLFLVPAFINNMAGEAIYWVSEHAWSGYPAQFLCAVGALALVADALSKVIIGQRMMALQYFLSGQSSDLKTAVDAASRRWFLAAILMVPVIAGDLIVTALGAGAGALVESIEHHVNLLPAGLAEVGGMVLLILFITLSLPYLTLCTLNAIFMAVLVREKISVWKAMQRFLHLAFSAAGSFWSYVILLGIVYYMLSVPVGAIQSFELLAEFFHGTAREIADVVSSILDGIFLTPIAALYFSSLAVSGVLIHYYICASLEGADLKEQMSELKSG